MKYSKILSTEDDMGTFVDNVLSAAGPKRTMVDYEKYTKYEIGLYVTTLGFMTIKKEPVDDKWRVTIET